MVLIKQTSRISMSLSMTTFIASLPCRIMHSNFVNGNQENHGNGTWFSACRIRLYRNPYKSSSGGSYFVPLWFTSRECTSTGCLTYTLALFSLLEKPSCFPAFLDKFCSE